MEGREEDRRPAAAAVRTAAAEEAVDRQVGTAPTPSKHYRGVRMRKWGKWVAEIREPNKRSRIWLGSYSSPVAAARAYDTAVYLLRGRSAKLNFPEELAADEDACAGGVDLSAASVRKKAAEVGARVDALQAGLMSAAQPPSPPAAAAAEASSCRNPDLNQQPSPENSDEG
ncbi:Ethylene-responsive transcription factor ERF008 [Apostasia shenzhenica]|uniref:Ethylene-responsive transcription factor ERF008 n=1 Tax=Apostasia shenzhenica TaxID=1088818 RepID=A0A2I0BDF9_9ASPA|nr:Ethylene-responsive transcription factor ERF008 [Apostasia shenzhenica]